MDPREIRENLCSLLTHHMHRIEESKSIIKQLQEVLQADATGEIIQFDERWKRIREDINNYLARQFAFNGKALPYVLGSKEVGVGLYTVRNRDGGYDHRWFAKHATNIDLHEVELFDITSIPSLPLRGELDAIFINYLVKNRLITHATYISGRPSDYMAQV